MYQVDYPASNECTLFVCAVDFNIRIGWSIVRFGLHKKQIGKLRNLLSIYGQRAIIVMHGINVHTRKFMNKPFVVCALILNCLPHENSFHLKNTNTFPRDNILHAQTLVMVKYSLIVYDFQNKLFAIIGNGDESNSQQGSKNSGFLDV